MKNEAFLQQMKEWRRHLHMYPESAFEEVKTSGFISEKLSEMGLEVRRNIGGTGVVGSLKVGDGEEAIGLRADIDCINMTESSDLPYKSRQIGKMHACGHDGHIAALLGAARLLSTGRNFSGTVHFIFQPAEEPGKGAAAMIHDGLFERFPMDEIYGLHNMPGLPAGSINVRAGSVMASEDNFTIKIKGKGGHASSPHMGIDPLVTASEIILSLQTIVARNINPMQSAVISCTEISTDGAHNAIPTHVTITGDTRSFDPAVQKLLETRMRSICEGICLMNGAECDFKYTHEFAPTINWEKCVKVAVIAGEKVAGTDKVNGNCEPIMVSEDFGAFLRIIPGCFVFIGGAKSENSSDNIPLHNSGYDFNDDILETGAEFFAELIKTRLAVK